MSDGLDLEPQGDEELCMKIEITHPDGESQQLHVHLVLFDEEMGDISAVSLLQLADDLGRITGTLDDNQHFQLVERDDPKS